MADTRCLKHSFEVSENCCRNCGNDFCSECLVYAFGATKPPYCVACALAAAGVRSNAGRQPTLSRREIRRLEKERKRDEKRRAEEAAPRVEADVAGWAESIPGADDEAFAWAEDPETAQR